MLARSALHKLVDLQRIRILDRDELLALGLSSIAITREVRAGRLTRLRRDRYVVGEVSASVAKAVTIGGRIGCVTLLREIGVFVLSAEDVHVHVPPHLSRSRRRRPSDVVVHWVASGESVCRHAVTIADAIRLSVRCQPPRATIATLDSVIHHRLMTISQLEEVLSALPAKYRRLLKFVDGTAESGPETFVRLILRALGCSFESQVLIAGVGRVDFVVDGWLIIECDSREFHEGWEAQLRDRHRDLAAARLGYVTIRPLAADIFWRQDEVREAIRAVIDAFGSRLGAVPVSQLRRNTRNRARNSA